jgi:rare lipoprotein A
MASWYGSECSKIASGERYGPSAMTAAHRSLFFGTMVQLNNLLTGCNATVRINDRGPYRKSCVIDVSKAAAQQLKMIQSGTAKVEFCVIR